MDKFKFFLSATAMLSMSLLQPATWAQDATGQIAGNITDPSGAVVPLATVIVTNLDTKTAKQAATNSQGFYQALQLPIGRYEVSVEAPGFSETVSIPASPLEINQTLRVDMTLEVGAAHTQVTVESRPGMVETGNSTVGGTVTGEAIFELPLNGRDTLDLLATQPGVTPTNPDSGAQGAIALAAHVPTR